MNFKTKLPMNALANPLNWKKLCASVLLVSFLSGTSLFANINYGSGDDSTLVDSISVDDDYFGDDSTFVDHDWDEEELAVIMDELGFDDEDEFWAYVDSMDAEGVDVFAEFYGDDDDDEDDYDHDWDEEELAVIMDELGFDDEDEFWAYVDSMENEGIDVFEEFFGDEDWFDDDEDGDGDVDWDDFAWGHDDEDEDDCPFDIDDLDDEYGWDDEEDHLEDIMYDLGFDDEDEFWAYVDSLEEEGIHIFADYFEEDEDELEEIMDELGFDDEDEFWAYVDSMEMEGEDVFADFYGDCDEDDDYYDDEDGDWDDDEDYDDEDDEDYYDHEDEAACEIAYTYTTDSTGAVTFTAEQDGMHLFYYDFGDGNESEEENPTNVYPYSGTYEACFYAYDSINDCVAAYCDLVNVSIAGDTSEPCDIIVLWDYDEETDEFYFDLEIDCFNRNLYNTFWQFGDLTTSKEETPKVRYGVEREYQITVFLVDDENNIVAQKTQMIEYKKSTASSIEETKRSAPVLTMNANVFPNPTVDQLNLNVDLDEATEMTINIVDIHGKVVLSQVTTTPAGSQNIKLNVSSLPVGAYHVNSVVNGATINKTFMKTN